VLRIIATDAFFATPKFLLAFLLLDEKFLSRLLDLSTELYLSPFDPAFKGSELLFLPAAKGEPLPVWFGGLG